MLKTLVGYSPYTFFLLKREDHDNGILFCFSVVAPPSPDLLKAQPVVEAFCRQVGDPDLQPDVLGTFG